jgi:putative FmdB family regulatory protein
MPNYDFSCVDCSEPRTVNVAVRELDAVAARIVCRACGGKLKRVFSPPAVVFKGPGFFRTDNRT